MAVAVPGLLVLVAAAVAAGAGATVVMVETDAVRKIAINIEW